MASGAGFILTNLLHEIIQATRTCIRRTIAHHRDDVGRNDELTVGKRSRAPTVDGSGDQVIEAATRTNGHLATTLKRNDASARKRD